MPKYVMNLFPWVIKKIQGNYLKEIVIFVHKLAKNKLAKH